MKKELVLVRDLHGFWSCALCVSCTEGKKIIESSVAIDLIKNEYPDLTLAEFIEEGIEIFALVNDSLKTINLGERCK